MRAPASIAMRLMSIMAIWTILGLVATGTILNALYRQEAEETFEQVALAYAYNAMGAFDIDDSGNLTGTPLLGDARFNQPLSGWSWSIGLAQNPQNPILHSASLPGGELEAAPKSAPPFDENYRRSYRLGARQRLEARLFIGERPELFQVTVETGREDLEKSQTEFLLNLIAFFVLLASGILISAFFTIRLGLKPLKRAGDALAKVREGDKERLDGFFGNEVQPLVDEINALIAANRGVLERARTALGNLAHGLKTPLAVMANENENRSKTSRKIMGEQLELMKRHIQFYLQRARIAAQRGRFSTRTKITPVIERLSRVLNKLNAPKKIEMADAQSAQSAECARYATFSGEIQDFEEIIGNLLDNACRFAEKKVLVRIAPEAPRAADSQEREPEREMIRIEIEDDGPGVAPELMADMVKRGVRLDERSPGSGLGLSIVKDIIAQYNGKLEFETGQCGGLCARVIVPGSCIPPKTARARRS